VAPARAEGHTSSALPDRLEASPPTPLTIPDPQGRPVAARLVVTGGGHGQPLRIELEPADLGRVEVSLRLHDSGAAAANFTVDRPETLHLLQRDARTVTEMLTSAGFTVDQGSLGFTLRDGGSHPGQPRQPPTEQPRRSWDQQSAGAAQGEPLGRRRRGLLDLHV
jgi:flagellar hook-length control protein FliK